MLYHETKNPLHVMEFLGHREIKNTLLYVQLEKAIFNHGDDKFTVKIAKTPKEISSLLEAGFEYVCQKDGQVFLRKRK